MNKFIVRDLVTNSQVYESDDEVAARCFCANLPFHALVYRQGEQMKESVIVARNYDIVENFLDKHHE